jgi:hypothetical protein
MVASVRFYDVNQQFISATVLNSSFTTPSNCKYIGVRLENSSIGTFDFIKPQLYQLDGTEGTIVGAPSKLRKPNKRTLYAKR